MDPLIPLNVPLACAILARTGAVLMVAPAFGSRSIPVPIRIGLALALSCLLYPLLSGRPPQPMSSVLSLAVFLLREMAIGLLIGWIGMLVVAGIRLAGELLDIQMGFGLAQLYDPLSQQSHTVIAQFYHLLALVLFFSTDAHLFLLAALARSYQSVPPGGLSLSPALLQRLIDLFRELFPLALRIAMPIAGLLLLIDLLLGYLARTLPQLNVFAVGFAVKIAAGLLLIAWTLPQLTLLLHDTYRSLGERWLSLFG